jgi:predicted nucleic acid-binding protein
VTPFVPDASSVLARFFPDEEARGPDILDLINGGGAIVPMIWPAEITNGLFQAVRRRRTNWQEVRGVLAVLIDVKVELVSFGFHEMEAAILPIARRHSLTAYDTLYLHLAKSRRVPLHSNDKALRRAAELEKVPLA